MSLLSTPPRRPTNQSTPPRNDSLPPPTSAASVRRSPRLGQDAFDADVAAQTSQHEVAFPSPRSSRVQPRRLFVDDSVEEDQVGIALSYPPTPPPAILLTSTAHSMQVSNSEKDSSIGVDSWNTKSENIAVDSTFAPRASARDSSSSGSTTKSPLPSPPVLATQPDPARTRPTLQLLFSFTTKNTTISIVLPGVLCAIASGAIPAYMTELVGQSFQAFTDYAMVEMAPGISSAQLDRAGDDLLDKIRRSAIQFAALALATFVLGTAMISLWIVHGERTAQVLRYKVFQGVSSHELAWFETGAGSTDPDTVEDEAGTGSGGLMGRFTKETDDVRAGTSQNVGVVIQNLTTFLACLILSFYRDWRLTLVILASVPLVIILVAITERFATPLILLDRNFTGKSNSRLDRVFSAITTVKAFNAEKYELLGFATIANGARAAYDRLSLVWGIRTGLTQFIMMAMFVQGFWFGAYLIRTGLSTVSQVNTCFWACLLATSYVQQCVPLLVTIERAKVAMASLVDLAKPNPSTGRFGDAMLRRSTATNTVHDRKDSVNSSIVFSTFGDESKRASVADGVLGEPFSPRSPTSPSTPVTPTFVPLHATQRGRRGRALAPRTLRKLQPPTFTGELSLRNVTFHYPSRPHPASPALDYVSIYLAARETTYIVGASGSGKSTVGSLLLGLYQPEEGHVEVDEQALDWIDEDWLRGHVACVSQGASVLFNGTVHDNVAVGVAGQIQEDGSRRLPRDVTREEVINACRGALIHDFIKDLPDGYDTWLSGEKGASLSGGQRQRLAIARAWVREPTVLILDEATSALDTTSRLLVSEAIKVWRKNRTTIIITHDLTPIDAEDFVYVMEEGHVVEQGYRVDLENKGDAFHRLMLMQGDVSEPQRHLHHEDDALEELEDAWTALSASVHSTPRIEVTRDSQHFPVGLFGVSSSPVDLGRASRDLQDARRISASYANHQELLALSTPPLTPPRPTSGSSFGIGRGSPSLGGSPHKLPNRDSSMTLAALELAATTATGRRPTGPRIRHAITQATFDGLDGRPTTHETVVTVDVPPASRPCLTLGELARFYHSTIPNKWLLYSGFIFSVAVGACTPIFSALLSKLIADLAKPDASSLITKTALLVLLVAFVEGVGTFLKYYLLERCAMGWTTRMRKVALSKVIKQDKSFFDRAENSTSALCHSIVKDSEDARLWVGTIIGQLVVVASMLLIGLIWAFASGWELTLVGLGLGPVFIIATRFQALMLSKLESENKRLREDVSRRFHQAVSNVKAIRSMSIQSVFDNDFLEAASMAYAGGVKAGPFAGMCTSTALALTYGGEALLFYVGAVLVSSGRYDYAQMMKVFALIIFSVTFATQVMVYIPGVAKASQAATDLKRLLDVSTDTSEARGQERPRVIGDIRFKSVNFTYPTRRDVPVLCGVSFSIPPGACVGIVGASGSGKSTITSLLQRLYVPDSGVIELDGQDLSKLDVAYLREHVAVVSQHPALFDMTIAENIAYGREDIGQDAVERAARAAHVHDFILSLPRGYSTLLGESASLISGGQAQRLQIARALVRSREILILDECTSALDAANQSAVMETIMAVKEGKTTLIVTHKLAVMEKCDYLLVMHEGRIAETGTVEELKLGGGIFADLASGGEWGT